MLRYVLPAILLATLVEGLSPGRAHASGPVGEEACSDHWAFAAVTRPDLPASVDPAWTVHPIDRFVAHAQQREGIGAAELASPGVLVRRLFFDLTGLPPTPAEVDHFVVQWGADPEAAWERQVDDLLGRLEFGERWGRHWLDVARYADSNGCSIEANNTYDNAWRYRDYVIDALNNDKPFDDFVVEQVAGDLLESAWDIERSARLVATGFLLLGPKAFGTGGDDRLRLDVVDEQIDTVGKAFLGLTLGCARCHDHKFDPFPTSDYYALAGVFSSTQSIRRETGWRSGRTWNRVALPVVDEATAETLRKAHAQRLKEVAAEMAAADDTIAQSNQRIAELQAPTAGDATAGDAADRAAELEAQRAAINEANVRKSLAARMQKVLPIVAAVPSAMAVADAEKPADEAIRVGGDFNVKGEIPPRGMPHLLGSAGVEKYRVPPGVSGRLQLARWLVDTQEGAGALVARVQVNRIWAHLMGRPIVRSVDDLGLAGDAPTHPELLDHLAGSFIDDGWSVKRLVRRMVLTRTYRLSSNAPADALARDPDNVWLGRRQVRRLDAEALRDAVLAINGTLDRTRGGSTLQQTGLVTIHSDFFELDTPSPYRRRTVYLPMIRDAVGVSSDVDETTCLWETFNGANLNLVTGARSETIVPTQALLLLNSPFMLEESAHLASRLSAQFKDGGERGQVRVLYRLAYGRPADDDEIDAALQHVAEIAEGEQSQEAARSAGWVSLCQAVLGSNEFLFLY
jgi:hypothetical protein